MTFNETKEMTAVLFTAPKHLNADMHSAIYELVWSKLCMLMDTVALYILMLVLMTLTMIQSHMGATKHQLLYQSSHKVLIDQLESRVLLRLFGVMNLILILSRVISLKEINFGLHSDIH